MPFPCIVNLLKSEDAGKCIILIVDRATTDNVTSPAELLNDNDIETLRHLVNTGMGANPLRAITSDLAYVEAWALATTKRSLPWPAPEAEMVVVVRPFSNSAAGMLETKEQAFIQQLVTHATVEALDIAVLH